MFSSSNLQKLLSLTGQLPTGLADPRALDKLAREIEELRQAILADDYLGTILEAADVAYYATKAAANDLMSPSARDLSIARAASLVGLDVDALLACAVAKMGLRAIPGSLKDDDAERAAVQAILET